jgi:hypothetical protein
MRERQAPDQNSEYYGRIDHVRTTRVALVNRSI